MENHLQCFSSVKFDDFRLLKHIHILLCYVSFLDFRTYPIFIIYTFLNTESCIRQLLIIIKRPYFAMYNHKIRYLSSAYVLQERFITQKSQTNMMCYITKRRNEDYVHLRPI